MKYASDYIFNFLCYIRKGDFVDNNTVFNSKWGWLFGPHISRFAYKFVLTRQLWLLWLHENEEG